MKLLKRLYDDYCGIAQAASYFSNSKFTLYAAFFLFWISLIIITGVALASTVKAGVFISELLGII